jgi:hypothetical protein
MQYRFTLTLLIAGLICLASFTSVPAQDEVMTNDEVISLTKAGLSPAIILGKIRSGKSNFDTSTDSLIKLKQAWRVRRYSRGHDRSEKRKID